MNWTNCWEKTPVYHGAKERIGTWVEKVSKLLPASTFARIFLKCFPPIFFFFILRHILCYFLGLTTGYGHKGNYSLWPLLPLNFSGFFLLHPPPSCLSLSSSVPWIVLVCRLSLFNHYLVEGLRVCLLNVVTSSQCYGLEMRRVRLSEALHLIPLFGASPGHRLAVSRLGDSFSFAFHLFCCFGAFEGDEGSKESSTIFNQSCSIKLLWFGEILFCCNHTFQYETLSTKVGKYGTCSLWKWNVIERKKIIFLSLLNPSILITFMWIKNIYPSPFKIYLLWGI